MELIRMMPAVTAVFLETVPRPLAREATTPAREGGQHLCLRRGYGGRVDSDLAGENLWITPRPALAFIRHTARRTGTTLCPECGVGDRELGHTLTAHEIYCVVCLDETGRQVRLHRWEVVEIEEVAA
jgi:hypothetical protein